ncbi:DUF2617 family protein [Nocardiopsis sp. LOL_012]|uniref:DUF2617 family protein n=1 Tax=Nocardiopsis sp. LOL_012 TaxID=3345409 RepID=UPI003A882A6D
MLASISVPFVDTSAADLVWTLDHPLIDPLATRSVGAHGPRTELRVLGASHQVVVESPAGTLVETVACLPGVDGRLPAVTERSVAAGGYRFRSSVETLSPGELHRRVGRLHDEVTDAPGGLLVSFPGDRLAVTALHLTRGDGGPLTWRTWHAYPQSGELVSTASTVTIP